MMASVMERIRVYLHDMNSDTWDLARWRKERIDFDRFAYVYPVVALFVLFGASVAMMISGSVFEITLATGAFFFLSFVYAIVGLWYYPRKIRQLEKKEAA